MLGKALFILGQPVSIVGILTAFTPPFATGWSRLVHTSVDTGRREASSLLSFSSEYRGQQESLALGLQSSLLVKTIGTQPKCRSF